LFDTSLIFLQCVSFLFLKNHTTSHPFTARLLAQLLAGHEEDLERRGFDLFAMGLAVAKFVLNVPTFPTLVLKYRAMLNEVIETTYQNRNGFSHTAVELQVPHRGMRLHRLVGDHSSVD
jgi:hypothetical protein